MTALRAIQQGARADFSHVAASATSASGFICGIKMKRMNLLEILDNGELIFASAVLPSKGFLQAAAWAAGQLATLVLHARVLLLSLSELAAVLAFDVS